MDYYEFFNLPELKNKKEISSNDLFFIMEQNNYATNNADSYFLLKLMIGGGFLIKIKKSVKYKIIWEKIEKQKGLDGLDR